MYDGVLSAIGNTPLVQLTRLFEGIPFLLFAKLEALNPGGSIKDRPAINIIRQGIEDGAITSDTVVVESSSGNMAIGLAQVCSRLGLRFICVVDPKTTMQNIRILEAYGVEVELVTDPDPATGEFLQARINRVRKHVESIEHSFWPNQYENLNNARAHHQTMREIATALGKVDYLFCATSTCGTLRGCADYIREQGLKTTVFAVDAAGSIIFGGSRAKRLIPGHGASMVPPLFKPYLAYDCIKVTDLDCVVGCHKLVRRESILAGGSSGAIIAAIDAVKSRIEPGAVCVAILADRGERYLDTIYSREWLDEHFGYVSHLWLEPAELDQCEVSVL
jgi:cysteine synthase A